MHPLFTNVFLTSVLLALPLAVPVPAQAFPLLGIKQKDILTGAPPLPVALTVSVDRRQPVIIPLRVLGPQPEPVRFVLRTLPQFGTATLLTPSSGSEGAVEYRAPEDRTITSDQLGFAVGNSKGFSSEATIVIRIIDRAGQVDLPARVDFPKARVGTLSQQTIHLKNTGDAPVIGSISVSAPWTIDVKTYVLKPQEESSVQVTLTPTASGSLQGELHFSHKPDQPVQLRAQVEEWIQASPDPLKLVAHSNSRERSGKLHLHNDSPSTETVLIESDPPLIHPQKVTLAPGASEDVLFKVSSVQSEPFGGTLRLTQETPDNTPGPRRLLLWNAEAIGAILRVQADPSIHTIIPDDPALFTPITLLNEGGREGLWRLQATPPFAVDSSVIRLLPGKSIDLHVSTPTRATEPTEGILKITSASQSYEFPLIVTPASPLGNKPTSIANRPPRHTPLGTGASSTSIAAAPGTTPLPMDLPDTRKNGLTRPPSIETDPEIAQLTSRAYLPGIAFKGSRLHHITHKSAILSLPLPETIDPKSLLIQTLNLAPDKNDNMSVHWDPLTAITITRNKKGHTEFLFEELLAATNYSFRVLGPPGKNGRRVALHQFDFTTLPTPQWFTATNAFLVLLGGGVLWWVCRWSIRRRRGW